MALLLKKTALSVLCPQMQKANDSTAMLRRGLHVEPGAREKALLADDPSLKRFKSHKKGLHRLKVAGDVITIAVIAGCCYEIYVKAVMREEARKKANESASEWM